MDGAVATYSVSPCHPATDLGPGLPRSPGLSSRIAGPAGSYIGEAGLSGRARAIARHRPSRTDVARCAVGAVVGAPVPGVAAPTGAEAGVAAVVAADVDLASPCWLNPKLRKGTAAEERKLIFNDFDPFELNRSESRSKIVVSGVCFVSEVLRNVWGTHGGSRWETRQK